VRNTTGARNDLLEALKANSNESTRRFEQFRHQLERYMVVSFFEGEPYGALGIVGDPHAKTVRQLIITDCRQEIRYPQPPWQSREAGCHARRPQFHLQV